MPLLERELKNLSAVRPLRAELLEMAAKAAVPPQPHSLLRITQPRVSEARIVAEWAAAVSVLKPEIAARLSLEIDLRDGSVRTLGASGDSVFRPTRPSQPARPAHRLRRRDAGFAVEKLLIWAWLHGRGPLTRLWLQKTAGCSYPSVATVVKQLGSAIRRHPDRRIELDHLPLTEWRRLAAVAPSARDTLLLADRSGRANATAYLERIQAIAPTGVAVGGVAAARHLTPDIDLTGLPRLDLSVHAPKDTAALGFLRTLDPALGPAAPDEPVIVALHFVRHLEPLFEASDRGVPWADPVEVLLDLQEAGLLTQAAELLDALTARVSRP